MFIVVYFFFLFLAKSWYALPQTKRYCSDTVAESRSTNEPAEIVAHPGHGVLNISKGDFPSSILEPIIVPTCAKGRSTRNNPGYIGIP